MTRTIASAAMTFLQRHAEMGQVVTGLLYVHPEPEDLHEHFNTVEAPLNALDEQELCPGSAALEKINAALRFISSVVIAAEAQKRRGPQSITPAL